MEMQDKPAFEMSAQTGLYDTKTEMLTLQQNVVVTRPAMRAYSARR